MNGTIRYTVRPYDTFWMLAQVFNTTADSIMELNPGVDPRNLQVGHVITIRPGYQYYPPYPVDVGNRMDNNMMNRNFMNDNMMNRNMMDNNVMDGNINDDMMYGELDGMLADLISYFRMLWCQHILWTRMVMVGILYELPELEFSTQRLLRNASDFASALGSFYGDESAREFEGLFSEHMTIFAELINAAQAGDTNQVEAIWQRWVDNANQIAEFMGNANPNWDAADWSAMMMEHLEMLGKNLSNMLEQDFQAAVNDFDDIESQAMEMADMMAEGIAMQFPE